MNRFVIPVVLFFICLLTPATCIVRKIIFTQECSGYLKQASDANTPQIALDRINKALVYIEDNNLTEGYTSIIYRTEDENVGFWYENIKACKQELEECLNSTQLEKTNVLMKVRESLTDTEQGDTVLTIPQGIYKYPYNLLYMILISISGFVLFFDLCWISFIVKEGY